jgi:metal-responsive CopG/Arc/MetJ family transcriptional regulator
MNSNYGQVTFNIKSDLIKRLDEWRFNQVVAPSRSAVIIYAVKEFLDREDKKRERK